MQVKPRFEHYNILEQHPIVKDDTGNDMCLTLFEVKLNTTEDELINSTYTFWTVVGQRKFVWNNKAVSYSSEAFWNSKKNQGQMLKTEIKGLKIVEVISGEHCLFDPNGKETGTRTRFILNTEQSKKTLLFLDNLYRLPNR